MQWFLAGANELIEQMHPAVIKPGMRMPREVIDMKPSRELIPVWDIQFSGGSLGGSNSASMYGGTRYIFRLSNGEQKFATASDRIYAVREIRPEDRPPHTGTWITNEPFGFHDHKSGVTSDRHWYEDSRALETHTTEDGRVYRLLTYRDDRSYWICRWDQGKKWLGPVRYYPEGAHKQWDAIVAGEAW